MKNAIDICVGSNLHLLRMRLGHSVEAAAKIAHIDPKLWQCWEAGEASLDANNMLKLKTSFDLNPSDLYIGLMDISDQE